MGLRPVRCPCRPGRVPRGYGVTAAPGAGAAASFAVAGGAPWSTRGQTNRRRSRPRQPRRRAEQRCAPVTTTPKMPTDWFFEDLAEGQAFRIQGRTITEADPMTFAGWSWATNPVPTDC